MLKIYDQFDKAFPRITAYAISDSKGRAVGRIAFKHPRDGMGRTTCFVQVWGVPMVSGHTRGCGYDKRGAALSNALGALREAEITSDEFTAGLVSELRRIGHESDLWNVLLDRLSGAGFHVLTVIG